MGGEEKGEEGVGGRVELSKREKVWIQVRRGTVKNWHCNLYNDHLHPHILVIAKY